MHIPTGTYTDKAHQYETSGHERLVQAWHWLCEQRRAAPEGADVWDLRWRELTAGPAYLTDLLRTLEAGRYRLTPMQLHGRGGDRKAVWCAQDALVLKWVALSLAHQLPLHPSCEHVKGHGGGKQSVHRLHALLTQADSAESAEKKTLAYPWVCRTDIRGYYRHINKQTLLNQVKRHVASPALQDLVNQYLHYTVEDGGTFHTPERGISRACPLSPLMGALHLYDMDTHFSRQANIYYARYMDDVIILAKSRWSLRRQTKRLKQWFSDYGFEAHPDKTQIGRVAKGFDWMGAWLTDAGVTDVAPRAKANHLTKVRRLYEQLARLPAWLRRRKQPQVHARVSRYRRRWTLWSMAITAVVLPQHHVAALTMHEWATGNNLPEVEAPGVSYTIVDERYEDTSRTYMTDQANSYYSYLGTSAPREPVEYYSDSLLLAMSTGPTTRTMFNKWSDLGSAGRVFNQFGQTIFFITQAGIETDTGIQYRPVGLAYPSTMIYYETNAKFGSVNKYVNYQVHSVTSTGGSGATAETCDGTYALLYGGYLPTGGCTFHPATAITTNPGDLIQIRSRIAIPAFKIVPLPNMNYPIGTYVVNGISGYVAIPSKQAYRVTPNSWTIFPLTPSPCTLSAGTGWTGTSVDLGNISPSTVPSSPNTAMTTPMPVTVISTCDDTAQRDATKVVLAVAGSTFVGSDAYKVYPGPPAPPDTYVTFNQNGSPCTAGAIKLTGAGGSGYLNSTTLLDPTTNEYAFTVTACNATDQHPSSGPRTVTITATSTEL